MVVLNSPQECFDIMLASEEQQVIVAQNDYDLVYEYFRTPDNSLTLDSLFPIDRVIDVPNVDLETCFMLLCLNLDLIDEVLIAMVFKSDYYRLMFNTLAKRNNFNLNYKVITQEYGSVIVEPTNLDNILSILNNQQIEYAILYTQEAINF